MKLRVLCLSALLAACGGGGGDTGAKADDGGTGTAKTCAPTDGARYCITELTAGGAALPPGLPIAMNDRGTVLFSEVLNEQHSPSFLWQRGQVTMLPDDFTTNGLNNSAAIAGWSYGDDGQSTRPGVWRDGAIEWLPSPDGSAIAFAIDDAGTVGGAAVHDLGVFNPQLGREELTMRAAVWRAGAGAPEPLPGEYASACDSGLVMAMNLVTGAAAGYYQFEPSPAYRQGGCFGSTPAQASVWPGDGTRQDLGPGTVETVADDGAALVMQDHGAYVTGLENDGNALALGPAGHVLFDDKTLRLPSGETISILAADFIDPALGWNLADLYANQPEQRRLGFDRLGRMFGVATHAGARASFIVTPAGVALPG
jgi:hypothetical protein